MRGHRPIPMAFLATAALVALLVITPVGRNRCVAAPPDGDPRSVDQGPVTPAPTELPTVVLPTGVLPTIALPSGTPATAEPTARTPIAPTPSRTATEPTPDDAGRQLYLPWCAAGAVG